jgi:hypothetical protein
MGNIVRNTTRPNWLPPSSPEIIKEPDGIPDTMLEVYERVNYMVNPWIFSDNVQFAPIPQVVELLPNDQRVPFTEIQGVNNV